MEIITTDKGNKYYLLDSTPGRQKFIAVEDYDKPVYDARKEHTFDCTPEELLPLMNQLKF